MPIGSLTGNSAIPTTPTYCTVREVAVTLGKPVPSAHNDEGEPTLSDWEQHILDTEDEIDKICGTSWRLRRELLEYHDWKTFVDEESWILIKLINSPVRTLSAAEGDALEVRQGGNWEDWLATKTQSPAGHFWLQEPAGFLRVRRGLFQLTDQARLRISYRYGESVVPKAIRLATRLLTAAELASGDLISVGGRGGESDRLAMDPRIRRWENRAYSLLSRYQKWGGS